MKNIIAVLLCSIFFWSCQQEYQPKPKGFLALNYPEAEYVDLTRDCPYTFEVNEDAVIKSVVGDPCRFNIEYNNLKGVIYITHEKVEDNLEKLLSDAQNLPLKHTIKADEIFGDEYENKLHNAYGMLYTVTGNAASQAQFYMTDSTDNFVTGSIYFKRTPNYDSIYPAAEYLKDDMKKLMETLQWKETSEIN